MFRFKRSEQLSEKSIPQPARSRLHSRMFLGSELRRIPATGIKLQPTLPSQSRNKLLILIRLRPAQPVIEVNNGENDTKYLTQLDQQPQQRNRINPARDRNSDPVSGAQQFLPSDMAQHALRQFMHENMVQPEWLEN